MKNFKEFLKEIFDPKPTARTHKDKEVDRTGGKSVRYKNKNTGVVTGIDFNKRDKRASVHVTVNGAWEKPKEGTPAAERREAKFGSITPVEHITTAVDHLTHFLSQRNKPGRDREVDQINYRTSDKRKDRIYRKHNKARYKQPIFSLPRYAID